MEAGSIFSYCESEPPFQLQRPTDRQYSCPIYSSPSQNYFLCPADMHVNGQLSPPNSKATVAETSPPSSPHESLTPSADDIGTEREEGRSEGGGGEGEARAATPPMMHTLLDMGFSRAQVNVALER